MIATSKRSMAAKVAAVVMTATLLMTGCNNEGNGTAASPPTTGPAGTSAPGSQPPPVNTTSPTPTTTPPTRPANPDGKLCGKGVNGCYSKDQMEEYFRKIIPLVQAWSKDTWGNDIPDVAEYQFIASGKRGSSRCRGAVTSKTFAYCPADDKMLIGQDALWTIYGLGDAAPILGIAHEYGHHVQRFKKVPEPKSNAESITHENQADCISGGWTQFATKRHDLAFPGDYGDIVKVLAYISSAEGEDRDHGTLQERFGSVGKGAVGGVPACNTFYPATPVK